MFAYNISDFYDISHSTFLPNTKCCKIDHWLYLPFSVLQRTASVFLHSICCEMTNSPTIYQIPAITNGQPWHTTVTGAPLRTRQLQQATRTNLLASSVWVDAPRMNRNITPSKCQSGWKRVMGRGCAAMMADSNYKLNQPPHQASRSFNGDNRPGGCRMERLGVDR